MIRCLIFLLVVCFQLQASSEDIYEYKALSVSVYLNDDETMDEAIRRAESMLQINAVTMTPKFVSHNTHYDSRTDEIVEKGLIAQGANVRVFNAKHLRSVEGDRIILRVTADVSVDVSAMKAKLGSEKRERLLESTINELSDEYKKLSSVLEKMKHNITLSNLDSIVVTDYYAALNNSMSVIDGDVIKQRLRAHKEGTTNQAKLSAEIKAAYEMFVFPFMANPIINYQVIDIIPHDYSVAEFKVRVSIDRKGDMTDAWFPSVQSRESLNLCQKFFYGCEAFELSHSQKKAVKELLRPKYCGDSLFEFLPYYRPGARAFINDTDDIECGRSVKYAYKNMAFYQTGYTNKKPMAMVPDNSDVFTTAFKELSNTAFWLRINIGSEKFKLNISNILTEDITLSAYMPEKAVGNGVKVSFSVEREEFNPNTYQWKDMSGKLLRYQSREIEFY
ncbi:hypothetical protein [Shewanella frigidimarina]|uniref:hypothetical protein n=1 Tax=Shewanella frigidimarina TaxID=56812 RepID=UPI003D794193